MSNGPKRLDSAGGFPVKGGASLYSSGAASSSVLPQGAKVQHPDTAFKWPYSAEIDVTIASLPLTPTEQKFVVACRDGHEMDFAHESDRKVRGELVTALATGSNPAWRAPRGVRIKSASIVGAIDLRGATLDQELSLIACDIPDPFQLEDSVTRTVRLNSSSITAFQAQRVRIRGSLFLQEIDSQGQLQLWDSRIEGSFSLVGASLSNPSAPENAVLDCGRARIDGTVSLERVWADGAVIFAGAEIRGPLIAKDSSFINPTALAFNGLNLKVEGSVIFHRIAAWGQVWLSYARLGSTLEFVSSFIANPNLHAPAINAFGLEVRGKVFLTNKFFCIGSVDLRAAKLEAFLEIDQATILHPWRIAFDTRGAKFRIAILLYRTVIRGQATLYDCSIGTLECEDSTFENSKELALDASRLSVSGQTSFRYCIFRGAVSLAASDMKGDLDLTGSRFQGPLILSRARLSGSCECLLVNFGGNTQLSVDARGMSVGGTFHWRLAKPPGGPVVFEGASIARLDDDRSSWPNEIFLDGFTYFSLSREALRGQWRLRWLQRAEFSSQAYEQAAKVLRQMGSERDARRILRAKQDDLRRRGQLGRAARIWNWLLGATLGHGYQVWRAALLLFALISVGAIAFNIGYKGHHIHPAKMDAKPYELPRFQPFAYSLDVGLPIIDLNQERQWYPRGQAIGDSIYLYYYWTHIVLGWLFTSLLVTGLTGLVKKE